MSGEPFPFHQHGSGGHVGELSREEALALAERAHAVMPLHEATVDDMPWGVRAIWRVDGVEVRADLDPRDPVEEGLEKAIHDAVTASERPAIRPTPLQTLLLAAAAEDAADLHALFDAVERPTTQLRRYGRIARLDGSTPDPRHALRWQREPGRVEIDRRRPDAHTRVRACKDTLSVERRSTTLLDMLLGRGDGGWSADRDISVHGMTLPESALGLAAGRRLREIVNLPEAAVDDLIVASASNELFETKPCIAIRLAGGDMDAADARRRAIAMIAVRP